MLLHILQCNNIEEHVERIRRRGSIWAVFQRELLAHLFGLPIDYYYDWEPCDFNAAFLAWRDLSALAFKEQQQIADYFKIPKDCLNRLPLAEWYQLAVEYREKVKKQPPYRVVRKPAVTFVRRRHNPFQRKKV